MSGTPLFPPVLCRGAKGKAVAALQMILKGAKSGHWADLFVNGDYDFTTYRCVQYLQARFSFTEPHRCTGAVDHHFLRTLCENACCVGTVLEITCDQFTCRPTLFTGPGFEDSPRRWARSRFQIGRAFPRWLNKDSRGRPVTLLKLFLLGSDRARNFSFDDDVYDEVLVARVETLQRSLGVDPDGHFGPQTRRAIAAEFGIDFDALPMAPFRANTRWHARESDPLQFYPRRDSHNQAKAQRSHLTMAE